MLPVGMCDFTRKEGKMHRFSGAMRQGSKFRASAALLVFAMLAALLSACGGAAPATTSATSAPAAATAAPAAEATAAPVASGDTIKVGILHSLSGTMSISEVSVRDAELLAIDEINAAGGVLGKQPAVGEQRKHQWQSG